MRILTILFLSLSLFTFKVSALSVDDPKVDEFINEMVLEHGFSRSELQATFKRVNISESVLKAISRPAERKLTWHQYRKIFFDGKRTKQGVIFWKKHEALLNQAYELYGVPPEIIVAIIGVETRYGRITGGHKVMDALSSLAFRYPRRATFFRKQLKEFLILTREQGMDPLIATGSYAGAMGIPQFIPSSYRSFAVDFDGDRRIDIWSNPADAIGSVANYFHEHKWKKDGIVTVRASVNGDAYKDVLSDSLKPNLKHEDLSSYEISTQALTGEDAPYKLLQLEQANGHDYWLGLHNFYVITRYNHSVLYAMAVYQLSQAIREEYEKTP